MTPKNYVLYKFEGIVKRLKRIPTEEEFYEEMLKESPVSTIKEEVVRLFGDYNSLKEQSNYYQSIKKYLIKTVLDLARDLKATPTQDEYTEIAGRHYIREYFGSYNELLKAVGLKPNKEGVGRKKQC